MNWELLKNKRITIAAAAVILVAVGFWYWQKNSYSKEILKLEILGPETAEVGQEIEYTVKYKNNGNIRLEDPKLTFEFPSYSLAGEGQSLRKEMSLEDIYPGQEQTFTFKTRLLGKEGEIKKARAWLNYKPRNLNARYESETSQNARLTSVPVTLEFDLPSKIDSGKGISFQLNYFSGVDYPLTNLAIKVEYPSDFEFQNSKPKALDKAEWNVGLLNKAEGGRIEISGNLSGEVGSQKQFKAQLGMWQSGEFVLLKETVRAVQIVTPSIYISQQINGSSQYTARAGDTLHCEVFFKNIGSDSLSNLFLVVGFEGGLFDLTTLKAPLGDFETGDNSAVFDWRKVPKLQFLDVGQEGRVEFWIDLKEDFLIANVNESNQVLKTKVSLSQAQKEFTTKVNSKLVVLQNGYFEDEVFGNAGPNPPQTGESTTYTIIWQAKNYYNDVKNASVKAILAGGASLTGRIFPEGSPLTFDSASREIVWKIDSLTAGKGILDAPPSVAFQISFTPASAGQANLVGPAKISGEDEFTGLIVNAEAPAIDTTGIAQ